MSCVDSVAIRRIASLASLILALALASAGVAGATTWNTGDMVTYSQNSWGDMPDGSNAATVLPEQFRVGVRVERWRAQRRVGIRLQDVLLRRR